MADTTATRGILIKLWPKLPDEEVDDFDHEDNAEFVVLRRKLTRWTQDNIARLKAARPIMPAGFDNTLAKNWKLLFAVADLTGGAYPQRARTAAIKLSHKRLAPSEGLRLFEVLDPMVRNRDVIPSAEIIERLTAGEDSEWREYGRGREPISQRGLAMLLEQFDIGPPGSSIRVDDPTTADAATGATRSGRSSPGCCRKRTSAHPNPKSRRKSRDRRRTVCTCAHAEACLMTKGSYRHSSDQVPTVGISISGAPSRSRYGPAWRAHDLRAPAGSPGHHRENRARQKLDRLRARPQGLPRRSLRALSSPAKAVRCLGARPRRWPPRTAVEDPITGRSPDSRRLGPRPGPRSIRRAISWRSSTTGMAADPQSWRPNCRSSTGRPSPTPFSTASCTTRTG
jgi:hypothetical protein